MKPVRVNFVAPSRPGRWHWFVFAVAWMLVAASGFRAWEAHKELAALNGELESLRSRALQAGAVASAPLRPPPYFESAQQFLRERAAPWPDVLRALEIAKVDGVSVRAVVMVEAGSPITVEVVAPNHAAVAEYLAQLSDGNSTLGGIKFEVVRGHTEEGSGTVVAVVQVSQSRAGP